MRWDVLFKDKSKCQVDLPDRLPIGVSLTAKVGDQEWSFRLTEDCSIVILEQKGTLEQAIKVRETAFQRPPDSPSVKVQYTLLAGGEPEPLQVEVEKYAPGAEGRRKAQGAKGFTLYSEITGKVLDVKKSPGEAVTEGDILFIIEAMKMENKVFAPGAGTMEAVGVKAGDSVKTGQLLGKIKGED